MTEQPSKTAERRHWCAAASRRALREVVQVDLFDPVGGLPRFGEREPSGGHACYAPEHLYVQSVHRIRFWNR